MIWASFDDEEAPRALEARAVATADAPANQSARILGVGGWSPCELGDLTIETPSVESRASDFGVFETRGRIIVEIEGDVQCFIPLSRPGPEQSRIYTSLGFASFRIGAHRGAGMFEIGASPTRC